MFENEPDAVQPATRQNSSSDETTAVSPILTSTITFVELYQKKEKSKQRGKYSVDSSSIRNIQNAQIVVLACHLGYSKIILSPEVDCHP